MKNPISKIELLDQLEDCLSKLILFNKIYDAGKISIAKEIAVKLRILFYNKNQSKSLIRQLKLEHIPFVDSAYKFDPRNLMTHHGLIQVTLTNTGSFTPFLESSVIKYSDFENWWDSKKVIVDEKKSIFTRKMLVLELADTDGGAHVDPGLNETYYDLTRSNTLGWITHDSTSSEGKPLNDPVPPSIRQISYETLLTFSNINADKESKLFK